MPTRIVREGINSSARINSLSPGAEVLYRRILSVVDDYGRFHGSPITILSACWPTCPDKISIADITRWLDECCNGGQPLIARYRRNGAVYIEVQNFGQKVRTRSKYPGRDVTEDKESGRGSIYFIKAENSTRVKIGFTELTPESRLAALQTGSPEKLILLGSFDGTMTDERNAHKALALHRLSGEWFEMTSAVEAFIEEKCCKQNAAECGEMPQNAAECRNLPALVGDVVGVGDVVECERDKIPSPKKQTGRGELPDAVFMEACRAAGIDGSETDWIEAGFEWRRLDFEQKLAAVEGIRIRMREAPDDPALTALPQNYLKKRMWQRPMRTMQPGRNEPTKIKMVRM